jgi:hypothetical protein
MLKSEVHCVITKHAVDLKRSNKIYILIRIGTNVVVEWVSAYVASSRFEFGLGDLTDVRGKLFNAYIQSLLTKEG